MRSLRPLSGNVNRTRTLVPDDKSMPVTPPQRNAPTWKTALGVLGLLVLFLIVSGVTTDLWLGFPLLFSARSWTTWLLGILALTVLYLLGEVAANGSKSGTDAAIRFGNVLGT